MQEQQSLPQIENAETASGKDLDPLLTPPDQTTIVQILKEKIDRFTSLIVNYNGSKKQLQSVLIALGMYPFTESSPTFGYKEAQDVFDLGVQILTDKLLFLHVGIKEQELAKNIREETEKEVLLKETLKETEFLANDNIKENVNGTEEN